MCAFLSFPVIWSTEAFGEEASDAEPVLETREVIVSATKTPLPIDQVTSAVQVITGEELERKKIKTVIDGLRLAQGVFATSSGGPGTEATVKMRGAFARHTLVLIDGRLCRIGVPLGHQQLFGNQLPAWGF
jgi:vitamin B12 transporter